MSVALWRVDGWVTKPARERYFDYIVDAPTANEAINKGTMNIDLELISYVQVRKVDTNIKGYVLAESEEEWTIWIEKNGLDKYSYPYTWAQQLRGLRDRIVFLLGDYEKHTGYEPEILYHNRLVLIDANNYETREPFRRMAWEEVEWFYTKKNCDYSI